MDRAAIVTGAARGIGLGIAKRLAREGCRVVSWDRDAAALSASKRSSSRRSARPSTLTDLKSVERAFEAAAKAFG